MGLLSFGLEGLKEREKPYAIMPIGIMSPTLNPLSRETPFLELIYRWYKIRRDAVPLFASTCA